METNQSNESLKASTVSAIPRSSPSPISQRILIFIVAYLAERHIPDVLERVPRQLFEDPNVEFLVIDDASTDSGANVAAEWARRRGFKNLRVLRNPVNQGYGGNQKLGYRLALDNDFDFVILLHGDGQYAPELLPQFIQIREESGADVVLGSRIKVQGSARKGGMPFYKLVGNRILTSFQNRVTRLGLSEFHTGYRGYSAEFLRRVPFEVLTNDFHFDTEILLQAAYVDAKIEEFAIPTRYGDEICYVNGFRYAFDVMASTTRFRFHQIGLLCDLKYRDLRKLTYRDKTHHDYPAHALAVRVVERAQPAKVLDFGCGPGFVAHECERLGARVTGVDVCEPLPGKMSDFYLQPADATRIPVNPSDFDLILLLDVIEHMSEPERFLLELRNRLEVREGRMMLPLVVVSTPNIAFVSMRLNLLLGRFSYAERGILDITHRRLFTRSSLLRSLRDCGYRIESVKGVAVPFRAVIGGRIGLWLERFSSILAGLWPSLFAFQTFVLCRPLPGVRQIVSQAELVKPG